MAETASGFVRDWISAKVTSDPALGEDTDARVMATMTHLMAAAREAGIDLDDPEMAPDLLRDLIDAAIKEASSGISSWANAMPT